MRKILIVALLFVFATGLLLAETKFKMELWNRWTYKLIDGNVKTNEMSLARGYFRLEPKFSENISGRFNLDYFSQEEAIDGAGLKLKYAYLDFKNFIPVKDATLTVGLMKTYFGTIYEWEYPLIEKDPSDLYKFVSSTDYGLGVSGYFPKGYGTYALAVYNGEGYKKTGGAINKDLNYLANLRVTPIVGVTLGGSYMFQSKNDSEIEEDGEMIDNPAREEYNLIAGVGKFAYGPVSVLAQYLNKVKSKPNVDDYEDVTSTVISVMPLFKVNNKIDILGRYDMYDPNTDQDDDGYNIIIAGVNYHIMKDSKNAPKLFVQLNYEMKQYEASDHDDETQILAQLRWIFSETFK
ncbi:MAG: hypothetical protein JW784_07360 [Candidatus Cloacimonetes bacterium]|nr:hypothetical protein [Candidatus Cloacimonadota bacterium]